eukprot:TRINITY_DN5238_c0_g1_i6.p1 TRINITY_DN5238_c0_g1~~TRINITY_DN5238_c0_g1_i6.p1  ORF type:complete len:153 (+),score=43.03 TRINITY_DN5238_c0_g1_i6:31-489(+)
MESIRKTTARFKQQTKKAGQAFLVLDKKLTDVERQQKREQQAEESRVRAQARADQLAKAKKDPHRKQNKEAVVAALPPIEGPALPDEGLMAAAEEAAEQTALEAASRPQSQNKSGRKNKTNEKKRKKSEKGGGPVAAQKKKKKKKKKGESAV